MPIISRKEFAELCGDDEKKLNVYIQRGKVIPTEDNKKLIDTENPVNALFIQQKLDLKAQKELLGEAGALPVVEKPGKAPGKVKEPIVKLQSKSKKEVKTAVYIPKTHKKEIVKLQSYTPNDQGLRLALKLEQEAKIRQQTIDMAELRIQSEKIRLDKTAGNLLPIDLGMGVIERHANSILKTFEKGFERIADIYANFAGMDPNTRTDFIRECRVELSHCVETAGKSAEAEIDILVDNYAETLMVGQKKA